MSEEEGTTTVEDYIDSNEGPLDFPFGVVMEQTMSKTIGK